MEPLIGQIMIFAGTFAPRGWALCNGQLLSIAQNTALFSIIGTTYGGDGVTTFALPNMQGRSCVGVGSGAGINGTELGQMGGTNSVSILTANLPSAPVTVKCSSAAGTSFEPTNNVMASAENAGEAHIYGSPSTASAVMAPATLQGGNQPLAIATPFLAMNWCIATEGVFPARP